MGLRIVTWNVNGIRNPFSYQPWRETRSFASMFDILEADIVVFQETKIQRKDLKDDMVLVPGWDCYFSLPKYEKGKFGVVIYTRQSVCAPIRAEEGLTGILCPPSSNTSFFDLPESEQIGGYPTASQLRNTPAASDIAADFAQLDCEGRCVVLEFPAFVLFGVYSPAMRDESRNAFRIAYLNLLDARIRNLESMGKRVVLTGDLNVSKGPLDIANAEADIRKSGMAPEEFLSTPSRRLFNHLLADGRVVGPRDEGREKPVLWDLCRAFHPDRQGMYTHWETKINARPGNYGSRIDYVLCTLDMKDWFSESNIQEGLMGSDHCPVYAILKETVTIGSKEFHVRDVMNPPGMYKDGERLRQYSAKDILPSSGRLISDFHGRQSIRDMFTKRPSITTEKIGTITEGYSAAIGLGSFTDNANSLEQEETLFLPEEEETVPISPFAKPVATTSVPVSGRSPMKRSATEKPSGRSLKRIKSSTTNTPAPSASRNKTQTGQMSIAGFFKPKTDTASAQAAKPAFSLPQAALNKASTISLVSIPEPPTTPKQTSTLRALNSFDSPLSNADEAEEQDTVHDPVESKESWAKLFTKPQVPLCAHDEPCKLMMSKKPGVNFRRWFYMCQKPLGPDGLKGDGKNGWRCGTFVWQKQQ